MANHEAVTFRVDTLFKGECHVLKFTAFSWSRTHEATADTADKCSDGLRRCVYLEAQRQQATLIKTELVSAVLPFCEYVMQYAQ